MLSHCACPLRDRGEDSIILAESFLQHFGKLENKPHRCFSDDARAFIQQYSWPGNIRQLENLIHSLVVLSDQRVIDRAILYAALEADPATSIGLRNPAFENGGAKWCYASLAGGEKYH